MKADWSDDDAEVTEMLTALNEKALPVLPIFPANDPSKPVVFSGAYTRAGILKALKEAGPSQPKTATAMK